MAWGGEHLSRTTVLCSGQLRKQVELDEWARVCKSSTENQASEEDNCDGVRD